MSPSFQRTNRRRVVRALLLVLVVTLAAAGDAPADKGGQGKGKGKGQSHGAGGPGKSANKGAPGHSADAPGKSAAAKGHGKNFADDQRTAIRSYYRDVYETRGDCPPGLAKKNNGCLPPGQEKRRWTAGEPLPAYVDVLPLPYDLRVRLAPPLPGYDYGYVDGEVLLFATDGRIVVDFVAVF